jgi:hypothetical protein
VHHSGDSQMTVRIQPIADINLRANLALIGKLGVVATIRFLHQFCAGSGDDTVERESQFQDITAAEIIV